MHRNSLQLSPEAATIYLNEIWAEIETFKNCQKTPPATTFLLDNSHPRVVQELDRATKAARGLVDVGENHRAILKSKGVT